MRFNAAWWIASILAGALVLLAGCQIPGTHTAPRAAVDQHDRPLSDGQVAEVQLTLARSLELRGEIEPALKAYQQAVEKDPKRATGYWRMATLQNRQGKVEESEALYQQALALDSKNPDLLCDYGYSLYLQRRWGEAEERLQQALALKPKHLRAHNNLGLVFAQAERADDAVAEFRKAGCNASDARSNLAFVMTLNHRWDAAREQYELALDANPDSTVASSGLSNLEAVVAKAESSAKSIELTNFERPARHNPAKVPTVKSTPSATNGPGLATLSATSPDE